MLIRTDQALQIITQSVKVLPKEEVKLSDALGRVLAEDIYAGVDIPGFDNSAMDGYALKSEDLKGAVKNNPQVLEVVDDVKAGDIPRKTLKNNQAIRIMTGALIPKGADCVVMVEDTRIKSQIPNPKFQTNSKFKISNPKYIEIFKAVKSCENIRKAGEDIRKG